MERTPKAFGAVRSTFEMTTTPPFRPTRGSTPAALPRSGCGQVVRRRSSYSRQGRTEPGNRLVMPQNGNNKTAFVLAGGGSLGAVQVGMLKALARQPIVPDFVVGASVGAINGAFYAAAPNEEGVARLESLWLTLRRGEIFPLSAVRSVLGLLWQTRLLGHFRTITNT